MNRFLKSLSFVFLAAFVAIALGALATQAAAVEPSVSPAADYQALLGKPLGDKYVADFIAANYCASAGQYELCGLAGIALGVDRDQKVETVFLFPGRANGFARFQGELPYKLTWKDSLASATRKLGVSPDATYLQQAGLPNESGTPDNIRLWVVNEDLGVTIVYNALSAADKNATLHAILITQ
jgi:hypothetical protein